MWQLTFTFRDYINAIDVVVTVNCTDYDEGLQKAAMLGAPQCSEESLTLVSALELLEYVEELPADELN